MTPSEANVVKIVESGAELRANQRVGGRVELTRHAVGLEAVDASSDVVYIVSPAGHNGVPFDRSARDVGSRETFLES